MTTSPAPGTPVPGWAPDPPTAQQWADWRLDPAWSRFLDVTDGDGVTHRWHVLDTAVDDPVATIVCVHGNPTWAYAWATFLRRFGATHRVIAVDQLGMGYSERTAQRRYATRVRDLGDVIEALDVRAERPLFLAAHDWGGAIAMGWAVDHVDRLAGMVLCNTGIAVPEGRSAPAIIRLAASAAMLELVCHGTPTFVEGTLRLSRGRLTKADRGAFRAPYREARSRVAIADFVDDIPLSPGDPSERTLQAVADRLGSLDVPVLLAWGARDPVFDDDFAADLAGRLPDTVLHRFADANHLVMAESGPGEVTVASVAADFMSDVLSGRRLRRDSAPTGAEDPDAKEVRPLWAGVAERAGGDGGGAVAFVDMASGAQLTFGELDARIRSIAAELVRRGVRPGDRVAMITPPGIDLVAGVYGVWRAGAVTVVADRGLGLRGLGAAIRSARVSWLIGPRQALLAAKTMRWAPRATGILVTDLIESPVSAASDLPPEPEGDDLAAVLFTSGATGPAKGVRYLHRQLAAQRDALARTYEITDADRLVAAFAPFALYGPALGIPTCLPACDVTTPGELTASMLDDACSRIGATLAFGSPAALAKVVATAAERTDWPGLAGLRIVFSAGAPVPAETLHAMASLAPAASMRTPYGMTEALPVADIDLPGIDAATLANPHGGVCVGHPVEGAAVRIVALDAPLEESSAADLAPGETGEILVSAPWVSDGYVGLWAIQRAARPGPRATDAGDAGPDSRRGPEWHRTGDVGHLDTDGRLWVEGRAVHVIHTESGPVTPVPIERAVERGLAVTRSAAVGVGPRGVQQLVVVLEDPWADDGLASTERSAQVRGLVDGPVAAVLTLRALPVDIRHNAKIDRSAVARWADAVLAGRRARAPKR